MRRAVALALALALIPGIAQAAKKHDPRIDAKIRAQQAKVHAVHVRLHEKRAQLDEKRAKVGAIQAQLDAANRNIAAVNGRLGQIEAGMTSARRKLAWNKLQLGAAQATLRRHQDALDRRLVDAYEHGDLGYVDVLLRARSFGDFVERWNDIRYLIKANEATIRERKADEQRVEGIQRNLLAMQNVLEQQEAAAEQQRRALDGLANQRRILLAAADEERAQVQGQVQELDEMSEEAEAQLNALVLEKQQELEAERAAQRRAARLAGIPVPPEPTAPGRLIWPVSGPITSPFGYRMHPVFHRMILHAGIDIAVPSGTTTVAAAAGRVIVAGWEGNCGNMVAIDHGGGLSTIYCHFSQIFVGVGQEVQQGQAIGAAGMTGDATGPHVHFQVDVHGQPVDPMSYLR